MKVSKKEIAMMLTTIDSLYNKKVMENENTAMLIIDIWYESLEQYPRDLVLSVFKDVVKQLAVAPTPADLIKRLDIICNTGEKTAEQLWEDLENAVYKVNQIIYYAEHPIYNAGGRVEQRSATEQLKDLYNSLDNVIKEYVPSVSSLMQLAEYDTLEYEKSRFLRSVAQCRQIAKTKLKYGTNDLQLSKNKNELLLGGIDNDD